METPDKKFSELVGRVKAWMPRRHSEPFNVSKDFWMPDHSCRVCYECDSQFTVFNRRHHCRHCGRVFCGKCTANFIPLPSCNPKNVRDEPERIRVCNFCFKQWEQDTVAAQNRASSDGLSPSASTMSFVSTKSSATVNSCSTAVTSLPYTNGPYQRLLYGSDHTLSKSTQMDPDPDKEDMGIPGRTMDSVVDDGSPINQLSFCANRSDDDDEEYGARCSDSEAQRFKHSDIYYGPVEFDEAVQDYQSYKMHSVGEDNDAKEICSPLLENAETLDSLDADKLTDEAGLGNSYDDHASSVYCIETADSEPVDFENNGLLWVPPDPEDEDDEREGDLFVEDDDEDAMGECRFLRSSNSFGSGDHRSRDQTGEEHKRAIKNVVDGHFRALIAQLLQVENISVGEEGEKGSWLEIITSLSWEAATLLKPDTSKGGGMDPGGYVKVKCIASGHCSQSMVIKGVVCKKNVAHRRMMAKIEKPHFLLLGGALEYQRVSNSLSSFDTLLQQEMDHLKMAVAKIDAHHPHVLLVEKSVSRSAQDYLLAKSISLVLNVKKPLLERIARCTGAQIVPSIDYLSSPKLGHCDLFHVEKFLEEHGSAGKGGKKMLKTLMFFEGCPKPLGCTVLLRGANGDELKKVKHVIQYGVFAAYHLALETSFLADEGASLPELPLKAPITVALPDKPPSNFDKSISSFTNPAATKPQLTVDVQRPNTYMPTLTSPSSGKMEPTLILNCFENHSSQVADASPSSTGMRKFLIGKRDHGFTLSGTVSNCSPLPSPSRAAREKNKVCFGETREVERIINDQTVKLDAVAPASCDNSLEILERKCVIANDIQTPNSNMMGKQLGVSYPANAQQENGEMNEHLLPKEEFPPDHQSILVSLSTRCVWKGTICERSHLFRIKYYGSFDKPLGRFLRDNLFDQSYHCRSCEMPSEAHVHCYTHHQGSLTISVRKLPEFLLKGEKDGKIWMWHRCLRCPRTCGFPPATRRVVMSDAAWGLSFGKFLELSFSNHAAASRVASCGHSLHRDCLRFYGFGKMVACFRYASIHVHSVYLPPHKLDFNYEHLNQEWIHKEADEVSERTELLYTEVCNALQQIAEGGHNSSALNGNVKSTETKHHILEIEGVLQKEKVEFEESIRKLLNKEVGKGHQMIDILEVNKVRRQLLFQSYLWDRYLIFAASLGSTTHEIVSGSLTRDKEKPCTIEKLADLNSIPRSQRSFTGLDALSSDSKIDDPPKGPIHSPSPQEGLCEHLDNLNLGQKRMNIDLDPFQEIQSKMFLSTSTSASDKLDPLEFGLVARRTLSDGQFPLLVNLSKTFDAKWTGEENSSALADAGMADSAAPVEATAAMLVSEDSEERSGSELTQSFASSWLSKLGDSAEDFSSWIGMPFVNRYRSMNKNWGTSPRFDNEYQPIYVSLFRDLERQGGAKLLLPSGVDDTVIPIYEDEPTSIIAYALVSPDYHMQISDDREKFREGLDSSLSLTSSDFGNSHLFQSMDEASFDPFRSFGSNEDGILSLSGSRSSLGLDPLTSTKALHARVNFADDAVCKVKYTVTCYYAKSFDALRRTCCPSELDFIRSLSRCKKWGAQGGKSNVFFAKSLDDRFIIKQVTKTELESFIKFAPEYFKYLSHSIGTGSPTCLAKILGIYQVTSKNLKGGKELKMDVLVMENLLFGRSVTRLYDLKGSSRSRYNPDSSGNNKVLLDQNLIEAMPTSPIFVGNKAKRLLERAVWNDTSFLASIDVMDYSLLVGVDEEKHELVLGIIDFMRQYTWDKHLETWVKASGILGGPKNVSPTVISPKQYKKRFRKAMAAYFLVVPDHWSPPTTVPTGLPSDSGEDKQQIDSAES